MLASAAASALSRLLERGGIARELVVGRQLEGQGLGGGLLEDCQLGLGGGQRGEAGVELDLLGRRLVGQLLGLDPGRGDGLVEGEEGRLVGRDLGRQDMVLVAEVDQVADVAHGIGERRGRQERLQDRGPVLVVGRPDVIGQEALGRSEVGRLLLLLAIEPDQGEVEVGQVLDLAVVGRLDDVHLGLGRRDRRP